MCKILLYFSSLISHIFRVGNLLFGFASELLVFVERKSEKAIHPWKRANHSGSLFCKERRTKMQGERFTLGHKRGKAMKNCQKNVNFFWRESLVFENERENHKRITTVALLLRAMQVICSWSHFFKE